jgi:NADH dehydrogenase FAD-containing subunit
MDLSRRNVLKYSTLLAGVLMGVTGLDAAVTDGAKSDTPKKKPKKRSKVVIVGGGWSGLSIAKYTKVFAPDAEVTLVEQKDIFFSCPISNLWMVDKIDLEFITHDYLKAARTHGYTFFNATATGVDKKRQILHTSQGDLPYDYLVLAVGIDYDYSRWNVDAKTERRLRQEYPPAFKPSSEHFTLKEKIHNFKGGTFLMTVPSGNYRCLPAPYERACIIADFFKKRGIKAKILLLDENGDITIKEDGFHTAFKELYKDYIDWQPNIQIEEIDLDNKVVRTEFDEYHFDDASFYPHVRGGRFLEIAGVAKDTVYNRLEGDIDVIHYTVKGYDNIYVAGDARPMGFSKSGNTAYTEGQHVAKLIAAKINALPEPAWESPITLCISAVSIYPERGIFIHSEYAYDKKQKNFYFATPVSSEEWRGQVGLDNGKNVYGWAKAMYVDMFGN